MTEWKEVTATDFCKEVTDGTHDSPKPVNKGKYLLTSKHLLEYQLDFDNAYQISQEDYEKVIARSKVEQHDVLFSMIGTIGTTHRVSISNVDFAVKNMGIFKMGGDEIKSKWLYYWLKTRKAKEYIHSTLSGTTQGYITLKALRYFPVLVPNDRLMKTIVSILSSLDDKIECNRKICANLEAQAQALFKNWFVDFAPFKNGKFVESELGMIPEGWRVGTLMDLGDVVGGATPSKSNPAYFTDKGIAWLTPKDLSNSNYKFTSRGEIDITEEGYKSTSTKLMPKGSVLFSSRAPIGYITIAKNEICTNQGFKSVVPKVAGTAYLYYFLKTNTAKIESMSSGTTFKEASGALMKSLPAVVPPQIQLDAFENTVKEIFSLQESLETENQRLSTLRDTLLPKLMSGEIKI